MVVEVIQRIRLEYFEEAVHGTVFSHTVTPLGGVRKLSVVDVERLISDDTVRWMVVRQRIPMLSLWLEKGL